MTYREEVNVKIQLLKEIIEKCGDDRSRYQSCVEGSLDGFLWVLETCGDYLDKEIEN